MPNLFWMALDEQEMTRTRTTVGVIIYLFAAYAD